MGSGCSLAANNNTIHEKSHREHEEENSTHYAQKHRKSSESSANFFEPDQIVPAAEANPSTKHEPSADLMFDGGKQVSPAGPAYPRPPEGTTAASSSSNNNAARSPSMFTPTPPRLEAASPKASRNTFPVGATKAGGRGTDGDTSNPEESTRVTAVAPSDVCMSPSSMASLAAPTGSTPTASGTPSPMPTTGGGKGGETTGDFCTCVPRRLQNKILRSLAMCVPAAMVPQLAVLQPAAMHGCLGDMRGEKAPKGAPTFSLRHLLRSSRVVLGFRMAHLQTQYLESLNAREPPKSVPTVTAGWVVKEPVMCLMPQGPWMLEQTGKVRAIARKQVMEQAGMYATVAYMPSILRKGVRKKQRAQFLYKRELVAVLATGVDSAACVVAQILPDALVNLKSFDENVRQSVSTAFRASFHKLYELIVSKEEENGLTHHSDLQGLRAPKLDVSLVYIRDDVLYAATTVGAPEAQLFCLTDVKSSSQVVALDADSHAESDLDERSMASDASSMMSSSRQDSQAPIKPKRRFDIPNHTTFCCHLQDYIIHPLPPVSPPPPSAAAAVRMTTFAPTLPNFQPPSNGTATPHGAAGGSAAAASSGMASPTTADLKPTFAVVLSTEAFWTIMTKKEVWDLLFVLHELEAEARTHRSVDKTVSDIVINHAHGLTIAESTRRRLEKFYSERAEVHYNELPQTAEWSMASVLSEVAEAKAQLENADLASRMSVVLISLLSRPESPSR